MNEAGFSCLLAGLAIAFSAYWSYMLCSVLNDDMEIVKKQLAELKEELRETMRKVDVDKFVSNGLEVKLTKDSVRNNFDSKSFKEDNVELYNKYLKTTNVKGSLSIELERGI